MKQGPLRVSTGGLTGNTTKPGHKAFTNIYQGLLLNIYSRCWWEFPYESSGKFTSLHQSNNALYIFLLLWLSGNQTWTLFSMFSFINQTTHVWQNQLKAAVCVLLRAEVGGEPRPWEHLALDPDTEWCSTFLCSLAPSFSLLFTLLHPNHRLPRHQQSALSAAHGSPSI